MGKDVTLTGRTDIWRMLVPYMADRPWLGYGYGVFWSHFREALWEAVQWHVPHPHNGYIQLVLDCGVVGLAVFIVCLGFVSSRVAAAYRANPRPGGLFLVLALLCLVSLNLVETRLVKFDDFWWMLFCVVAARAAVEGAPGEPG
jgi:exopolysaccharide production protein ExoQ